MRHSLCFVVPVLILTAACSGEQNPSSPTPLAVGADQAAKGPQPVNVNGIVEALSGTADGFQFLSNGLLVKGDAATTFFGGSVFTDLVDGRRAEVKGEQDNGFVRAIRIHVNVPEDESTDPGDGPGEPPPVCTWTQGDAGEPGESGFSFEVIINSLTGTPPDLHLTVGRNVFTHEGTFLSRLGHRLPLDVLRSGLIVRILGNLRSDNVTLDAQEIILTRDTIDASVEGAVAGLGGTFPDMSLSIDGVPIITTPWTAFTPGPCDALVDGTHLRVTGVRLADGVTVVATTVELVVE